ncbi:methionyl-tRNA formyltransferase [Allobranchiibius sp. CTAmp26]|uniref:methionyl-tRNA formyltransferase n=1 Tax=Allobranchiibius sp. CTAmp26 TaxID=2815214 RepID=UPI001AA1440B|nr:methionyl-tRNA formyltransferase [Allobranchiibius sp. CTAmp26]MBO1754302.1 methionyl-tRNA formyltransferase [Allobranchiibius sp. CTAmp26]
MRVVFAGTPQVAVPSLQAVLDSAHDVVGVITRPDAPAGRGRSVRRSPVGVLADEVGVPVLTPQRPRDPDFLAQLAELSPDVCPVVAYGALVPRVALDVPRLGWINLHFSLLPAWRGAAPVQHAVIHGDEVTGATTFLLEEGMDTGPILGTMTEAVRPRDTSGDLLERLATAGAGLLVATLDTLAQGDLTPMPQPAEGVSLAPKISVEDAQIRWHEPAFAVDRRVRGVTPAPGAWTTFRGQRLKVSPVTPIDGDVGVAPGAIRVGKGDVHVQTGAGAVRLGTVQPQGKKAMPAADWARGSRIGEGEVFG